jgi:hypothetical protein
VFEKRVLRRIFGPKGDEMTGDRRKLHNEELHKLFSSPNIISMIKSSRMRLAGHVALAGNNNTEEGNHIHNNNKVYKEEPGQVKRRTTLLDEWMTPRNDGVLRNFIEVTSILKVLNVKKWTCARKEEYRQMYQANDSSTHKRTLTFSYINYSETAFSAN